MPIRRLKRFIAERHYAEHDSPTIEAAEPNGKRVAIVGSGPAGLTAAWQLARLGYAVKILEAAPEPGGFLRYAIPEYRLPQDVVEHDIANVTALGVEIQTGAAVEDLETLRADGFDAVLLATGTPNSTQLGIPGEETRPQRLGVPPRSPFREDPDLAGERVVIIGGGNVAMDAARTARRLGADVVVAYRRGREEMPAHDDEIADAVAEGVELRFLVAPAELSGDGLRCTRMELGEPDDSGRRRPEPVSRSEHVIPCDLVVAAVGMSREREVEVDRQTLQSETPWLFAAGDVESGPTDIARAVGAGRRAAHMIDRWLTDRPLAGFTASGR